VRGAFGNHNHRLQPHTIAHRNHLDAFGVVVVRRRCLELSRNVGLGGLALRERRQTRQSESQSNDDGTAEYGRPRVSWKTKTSRPQRRSASENRRVTRRCECQVARSSSSDPAVSPGPPMDFAGYEYEQYNIRKADRELCNSYSFVLASETIGVPARGLSERTHRAEFFSQKPHEPARRSSKSTASPIGRIRPVASQSAREPATLRPSRLHLIH
jgi:hypothetical protein